MKWQIIAVGTTICWAGLALPERASGQPRDPRVESFRKFRGVDRQDDRKKRTRQRPRVHRDRMRRSELLRKYDVNDNGRLDPEERAQLGSDRRERRAVHLVQRA